MNAFEGNARYAEEAKLRWGDTEAYRQSEAKAARRTGEQQAELNRAMDGLMAEFARCREAGHAPDGDVARELVAAWQAFLTEHYYDCTDAILAGLGAMYAADERFKKNIDRHGEGTARFMSDAIAAYCR